LKLVNLGWAQATTGMKTQIEALVALRTVNVSWRSEATDDDLAEITNLIYTMQDFEDRVDDGVVEDVEEETKTIVAQVNEKVVAVDFMVSSAIDRIDLAGDVTWCDVVSCDDTWRDVT
jgi:hypothetical protein